MNTTAIHAAIPRLRTLAVAMALVAPILIPAPATARFDEVGPLPWRLGGDLGFTVDAAMFPDTASLNVEVYVRVPPTTIDALQRDDEGAGRVKITSRLKNAFGRRQHSASQEFEIAADDTASTYGKVVLLRFPTVPGSQELKVELEDLNSRKRGLAYIGRKVTKSSKIKGEFEIALQEGNVLSDPEFALTHERALGSSPFTRFGRRVVPNPERLYGLFADELRVYFVARGVTGDDRPWRWRAEVRDAADTVVASQDGQAPSGHFLSGYFVADLIGVPAGGYDLDVRAWRLGDPVPEPRRTHFSIGWEVGTWVRNPRDVEDNVHFLLMPRAEEEFGLMHPGEQERFMADFWLERDPTPGTPLNEARAKFLQRIEVANERFTRRGLGRGMFSDMGRVFVRYGEPSEVLNQVIPTGDNTLRQILQELSITEDRRVGQVRQPGPGGDMRPFEVWIYEGEIPLPPDADPRIERNYRGRRLVFLFVDEQGLGDYRLRYSTE